MRSKRRYRFGTKPSATGGITRLACARLRELGRHVRPVLSGAGLTLREADDTYLNKLLRRYAEEALGSKPRAACGDTRSRVESSRHDSHKSDLMKRVGFGLTPA